MSGGAALGFLFALRMTAGAAPGYVDDALCAECHADLARSYRNVGMAKAFSRPRRERDVEDFSGKPFVHEKSAQSFSMKREGERLVFRRWQKGADGGETNVFTVDVDWVLGSGHKSRVYLYQTPAGELYQLPLAWYQETRRWGMAPGYDRRDHDGVLRPVRRECLFCHDAYPELAAGADLRGAPQRFPKELPEGLGCQRCHGPGGAHVAAARDRAAGSKEARATIVNPARLAPRLRDDVCDQCHLQPAVSLFGPRRLGRGDFSYRPGEALSDYLVVVDPEEEGAPRPERFEINHAPYRLRQSACFTKSGGALACLSCHDPHAKPSRAERAARVRAACARCHAKEGARGDAAARAHVRAKTDCASCHMPKRRTHDVVQVVMTDHWIARRPPGPEALAPREEREPVLLDVAFHDPARAPAGPLGDLYWTLAVVRGAPTAAALDHLEALLARAPEGFAEPLRDLASAQLRARRFASAEKTAERLLALVPRDTKAAEWIALARAGQGKLDDAIERLTRIAPTSPEPAEAFHNLGRLLLQRGDAAGARDAFRRAVGERSNLVAAWRHLASAHDAVGEPGEAAAARKRAMELDPPRPEGARTP